MYRLSALRRAPCAAKTADVTHSRAWARVHARTHGHNVQKSGLLTWCDQFERYDHPLSRSLSLSLSLPISLSLSDSCSPEMSNRTRRGCCCPDVCALQQHSPPPRGPAAPAVPSWTKSGPNWVRTAPGRAASWTDDSAPGPAGPSKPLGRSRGVGRACRRWGRRGSARLRGRCWRPQPAAFEAASLVAAVASPVAEVAFSTASWEAPVVRLGCVLLGVRGS